MTTNVPGLDVPYTSMDEIISGLTDAERHFRHAHDARAIFATAYLSITQELKRRVESKWFSDNVWVARYAVSFANLYRGALLSFERGDKSAVPKCWRVAFDAALDGTALVLQNLILGINAHINHDLPLALLEVSIDPDRERRHQDHTKVNEALNTATDPIKRQIVDLYAPGLGLLDEAVGSLDDQITSFSFAKAREHSWTAGVTLTDAHNPEDRAAIRRSIDDRTAVLARVILSPTISPLVRAALRRLEEITPWWTFVSVSEDDAAEAIPTTVDTSLEVHSLDELMLQLKDTIDRYDRQHSRMSVYPTAYLLVTQRFKTALDSGKLFEDNEWITRLDLHFATLYFRVLRTFEAGQPEKIPKCWATAFQATTHGETIVLQDLLLAVNARLNHDLAIALLRAGISDDAPKRRRDLERIHSLFKTSIDPIQELLAQRYGRFIKFLDFVSGTLDEMAVDFSYVHARDAAWDNAVALSGEQSATLQQGMIATIDDRATALAKKILLKNTVGSSWILGALRHVEAAFDGNWSEWVRNVG